MLSTLHSPHSLRVHESPHGFLQNTFTTHHLYFIHSHAYPKHLDNLRQMAPGPMSLSSLSPFPTQDKLRI